MPGFVPGGHNRHMAFAITHSGRRAPRAGDRVATSAQLDAALAAAGDAAVALWEIVGDPECGFEHVRVSRWAGSRGRDPGWLGREVRERMLAHVADLYLRGDCWVLAHVGAARHGLAVAMVVHGGCREGEPDHLALDLGGGRFLDANGVSSEGQLLARARRGAHVPEARLDAAGVEALYDRLYGGPCDGGPGAGFEDKLANGFGVDTEALFSMCLDRHVHAYAGDASVPVPMPR